MEPQRSGKKAKLLISSFFKKKDLPRSENTSSHNEHPQSNPPISNPTVQVPSATSPQNNPRSSLNTNLQSSPSIERDTGKRKKICEYNVNIRDEIRRAYLLAGPYQPNLLEYPGTDCGSQSRRFQKKWFQKFNWLEYSPTTNKAYCFYCFLFLNDVTASNQSALVNEGFDNWRRVNQGTKCAFLAHVGYVTSSPHTTCVRKAKDLMRPNQHIENIIHHQTLEEKDKGHLRLKTSIFACKWLSLQGLAFRGNDESSSSSNRGNYIELIKAFGEMNIDIDKVILENAPKNAQYIAPEIQKDILHIMANRVRQMIRNEVGDKCFCILVDEAQDISHREQMTIILRFVDDHGVLKERFFAIKSVSDTTSPTLKKEIEDVLVHYDLQVQKLRGQGYDGANNMRGAWNGLQALFLRDCPYAYYIHCFAHRLQLTIVCATKDVSIIWEFFSHLDNVVNIITSSPKRIAELRSCQRNEIDHMLSIGERISGRGLNQIGNLQRAGSTRWSSHYSSIKGLIEMYAATCQVFEFLRSNSPNGRSKAEIRGTYRNMASFEFIFVLHLMHKIMRITDSLCQILQTKSQDILGAIRFVNTTKTILQELRESGWIEFLNEVKAFCSKNNIEVPNLDRLYKVGRCDEQITVEHHYHFDVFNEAIDFILMELSSRFNETSLELLSLSVALDPRNSFASFNNDDICKLAKKFYPGDFSTQDIVALEYELVHYKLDVMDDPQFQVSSLVELSKQLSTSGRSQIYVMLTRLIHLVLTLPVSTSTAERAFSAMKHVKTALRNKMEDDYLADCLTIYIERDFAKKINMDSIIEEFHTSKPRRSQFR